MLCSSSRLNTLHNYFAKHGGVVYVVTAVSLLTLNAGIGFTERKSLLLSQISVILTCISQINEPIPGMFVLI